MVKVKIELALGLAVCWLLENIIRGPLEMIRKIIKAQLLYQTHKKQKQTIVKEEQSI